MESVDWESCQSKYSNILAAFKQQFPTKEDAEELGKDYPHSIEDLTKAIITSKLKSARLKYRKAVDTGRKSGHGKVVLLYFEHCQQLWGGSPETATIESGIESVEIDDLNECNTSTNIMKKHSTRSKYVVKRSSEGGIFQCRQKNVCFPIPLVMQCCDDRPFCNKVIELVIQLREEEIYLRRLHQEQKEMPSNHVIALVISASVCGCILLLVVTYFYLRYKKITSQRISNEQQSEPVGPWANKCAYPRGLAVVGSARCTGENGWSSRLP